MSENKIPQQSNNVHSIEQGMAEYERIKRKAAAEVGNAINTGDHHTISNIFRKPEDSYPLNVKVIKYKTPLKKTLSGSNELLQNTGNFKIKLDELLDTLIHNQEFSEEHSKIKTAGENLHAALENFHQRFKISNSDNHKVCTEANFIANSGLKNIQATSTMLYLASNDENTESAKPLMPLLAQNLENLAKQIQNKTESLGRSRHGIG